MSQAFWDHQADDDPLFAVLSDARRAGRHWDLREFFWTGEREIALLFQTLSQLGCPSEFPRALDFGCGVGRTTQALARRCPSVSGIDISERMIRIARALDAYRDTVSYDVLDLEGVRRLRDRWSLIYSNIVLQHLPPDESRAYVAALIERLVPGGVFVFQLPSHPRAAGDAVIREMPDAAYRSRVSLAEPPPAMEAGRSVHLSLTVTNESAHTWRQPDVGSVRVGNHWVETDGVAMLVQDDGRATLPQIVGPAEHCDVVLEVRPPDEPGRYVLELDLVHEGITWFADRGAESLRLPVDVRRASEPDATGDLQMLNELPVPDYDADTLRALLPAAYSGEDVVFPMYAVPQREVLDLIRACGATVIHLDEGHRAGSSWVDYRYVVRAS